MTVYILEAYDGNSNFGTTTIVANLLSDLSVSFDTPRRTRQHISELSVVPRCVAPLHTTLISAWMNMTTSKKHSVNVLLAWVHMLTANTYVQRFCRYLHSLRVNS